MPLFNGILSDLSPGVSLPTADYDNLRAALLANCEKENLQPLDTFFTKTIQLYEMIIVRHGLMLVGLSIRRRRRARTACWPPALDERPARAGAGTAGCKPNTKLYVLNPQCISMGQLHGPGGPGVARSGRTACSRATCASARTTPSRTKVDHV